MEMLFRQSSSITLIIVKIKSVQMKYATFGYYYVGVLPFIYLSPPGQWLAEADSEFLFF